MPRCAATKPDGSPCERIVRASQTYCYAHDPSNADKRRRDAVRAGRSTPNAELKEVKGLLKRLIQQVLSGELGTSPAAVANQLVNTRLRALELERRWKEIQELEERLEALEQERQQAGSRSWAP
jgi:hypothetical protein